MNVSRSPVTAQVGVLGVFAAIRPIARDATSTPRAHESPRNQRNIFHLLRTIPIFWSSSSFGFITIHLHYLRSRYFAAVRLRGFAVRPIRNINLRDTGQ